MRKKYIALSDISDIALVEKYILNGVSINTIRKANNRNSAHLPKASTQFGVYCCRCKRYMTTSYITRKDV